MMNYSNNSNMMDCSNTIDYSNYSNIINYSNYSSNNYLENFIRIFAEYEYYSNNEYKSEALNSKPSRLVRKPEAITTPTTTPTKVPSMKRHKKKIV